MVSRLIGWVWKPYSLSFGEVSEWLKEHAWKACGRETASGVRIPPSPPDRPGVRARGSGPFSPETPRVGEKGDGLKTWSCSRGGSGALNPKSALRGGDAAQRALPGRRRPLDRASKAGSHAMGRCEPGQALTGAAISMRSHVQWGRLAGARDAGLLFPGGFEARRTTSFSLPGGDP